MWPIVRTSSIVCTILTGLPVLRDNMTAQKSIGIASCLPPEKPPPTTVCTTRTLPSSTPSPIASCRHTT